MVNRFDMGVMMTEYVARNEARRAKVPYEPSGPNEVLDWISRWAHSHHQQSALPLPSLRWAEGWLPQSHDDGTVVEWSLARLGFPIACEAIAEHVQRFPGTGLAFVLDGVVRAFERV